jgi:transposase
VPSGKVHKSLRVDAGEADRVRALMEEGESEASAYNRVIAAGLDALEARSKRCRSAAEDDGKHEGSAGDAGEDAMRAVVGTVDALRGQLDVMAAQLETKDEQIRALTGLVEQSQAIASQSQTLHAMTEARAGELTDGSEARAKRVKGGGILSRMFGRR